MAAGWWVGASTVDCLLPRSVAQAKGHTGHPRGHQASNPGTWFPCSLAEHPLRSQRYRSIFCPYVSCARACVFVLLCFLWKGNKSKASTACVSTSPGAVETSNSPGQEGFPVRLSVHVQKQLAAKSGESGVHSRKGRQWTQTGGPSSDPPLPLFPWCPPPPSHP